MLLSLALVILLKGPIMPIFDKAALDAQTQRLPQAPTSAAALATPQSPSIGWGPQAATIGGNAADTLSTLYALKHGGQEGNPILGQNPMAIAGLKAAMTVPELLLERQLAKQGHPTMGKILGYAVGGLGAGLAAHNLNVVKGQ